MGLFDKNIINPRFSSCKKKIIPFRHADEYERMSLTKKGIVYSDKEEAGGLQPKDFNSYQLVNVNDLVFRLIDLQNSINREQSKTYQGKTIEILCEGYDAKKDMYLGRDTYGRMVYFNGTPEYIGKFVNVKITKTGGISLIGQLN